MVLPLKRVSARGHHNFSRHLVDKRKIGKMHRGVVKGWVRGPGVGAPSECSRNMHLWKVPHNPFIDLVRLKAFFAFSIVRFLPLNSRLRFLPLLRRNGRY